ncbi:hypothetical protein KY289_017331 [Solanum tuberosum]|nr:hypothetical protein KY289_017331 [Solanum tuberosum]
MALPNNIGYETNEVLAAQAHIANHVLNYINSMSLKCAIQLGIPDIIHSHDPIRFREESYLLTPTSRLLLKNEPLSLAPFVQAQLVPILMDPWHSLGDDPRLNRLFNEAMGNDARLITSVLIKNGKGVFEGLKSLVDVGGGIGTVAKAISNAFPELKCSVFDLPHFVEGLEGGINLSYIGGDIDEDCVKILKKCKEAIPSKENGGKVIVIDIVIDNQKGDDKSFETQLFSDVLMMVHVSGKERNEQEWAKLFSDAGFSDYKISPILGLRSVMEVYP